ncbi:C6 zinc finger domain-containing protein [Fusarium pseudocircinatum]|uniref:C6 zinc finger domain-containing protein n=1 Tax=Fusarium pseudocircinatum TaxID=56676 RepID=A0A8H5KNJ8_9HYPO|nr:C6 zinc finger domain-containing protein [Fusarium pseudocircinatum]
MVGPVLSGPTDSYFWTHLVMQFSHFEPTMRHAVLSISSLYEEFARGSRITRQVCGSTYAVDQYNAAIKHVKSASDEQMILVLCVLFICIEYLQGDFDAAMQHCRHGIMILNNSSRPEWMCQYLVPIFRRLSITPLFFGGGKPPTPLPQLIGFETPMPAIFNDTREAQIVIDDLMIRIMGCLHDGNDDRVTLASLLDEWDSKMNDLEQGLPASATADKYAICGMRFKHKMARIYIQQQSLHTEMWWDQHLDVFCDAVNLAEEAFLLSTTPGHQRIPQSSFSFEMSWLPMLNFIVLKCRDLKIRHLALSWLAQLGTAKEGLFDVGTLYRVGRRLIELEHDISLDDTAEIVSTAVPPEEKRYFAIPINHELEVISKKDGTVRYRRQAKFLRRGMEGNVIAREEYIYDDKPRGCSIQIPPMRCAYRL